MRLTAITANNVPPIKTFAASELSDVVVLAGPNGVGKTRLVDALIQAFRNPQKTSNIALAIEATTKTERKEWGKDKLNTQTQDDATLLTRTLQAADRRRVRWRSSIIQFESDRSIQKISPYVFQWEVNDPWEESIGWDQTFAGLKERFQDTLHSIFRKVQLRRNQIAKKAEKLMKSGQTSMPLDFPDSMKPFMNAFSQLLAPKELLDPDLQNQQLKYAIDGQTFPISSLSSGEREVVNIVFDFILREPSDCIIFFDEPELHLHPELSYKLLQTLRAVGERNQFILCTHSPDIITASLDQSVIFIAPPKEDGQNQAIAVREDDETNEALKLLGQSIGIFALGKKLVLIEGAVSSLDKQTYGAILRNQFPNLVLVPSGGRGIITSFELLQKQILDKTIWGIEFFMICDRDAVPPSRDTAQIKSDRLKVLNRYHLENYFLDEEILSKVFDHMEQKNSWLCSPQEIRKVLKEIARTQIAYAAVLTTSSYFREHVGNLNIMVKDCHGTNIDGLVENLMTRVGEEQSRIGSSVQPEEVEKYARSIAQKLQNSLDQDTDEWKLLIPGKQLLNIFANRAKLGSARLKTAYIKEAEKQSVSPFQEVIDIFSSFASS